MWFDFCRLYPFSLQPARQCLAPTHRVYRVPGFLSSCPNWVLPSPHPQASVAPPPPFPKVGDTFACGGRGWGDPIPRKGQSLWYSMSYTVIPQRSYPSSLYFLLVLVDVSFAIFPSPAAGMSLTKLSLSLVSDIPTGDGKIVNLFLQCIAGVGLPIHPYDWRLERFRWTQKEDECIHSALLLGMFLPKIVFTFYHMNRN
jgi:hypothetical protein